MMPFLSKFFDEIIVANETHRHNHAQLIIISFRKKSKKKNAPNFRHNNLFHSNCCIVVHLSNLKFETKAKIGNI